jgi:predicted nucleic acid-binding protein
LILVDTNVFVAASIVEHVHHSPSQQFLNATPAAQTLVAAHSLAECYSTLTKARGPAEADPVEVTVAVNAYAAAFRIVSLNSAQTVDAIRRFAALGGVGPRLYDLLIGATGEAFGADTIVT